MKIRSFLSLTAAISIIVLSSTNATAAQFDRSITTTKKSDGKFDLGILLNAFFKDGDQATRQALQQDLDIISSLLGKDPRAQALGFGTDPKDAKISPKRLPFLTFHVGLNDLRGFVPDKEASDLLMFTNQLLFPVEINDDVKSSVTVRLLEAHGEMGQKDEEIGSRITRWGLPKLIGQLDRLTRKLPPDTLSILVSIPSLNRRFLGYVEDTDIKLVPLVSDRFFTEGTPLSAKEVFMKLAQEAKSVDDSPR